MNRHIVRIRFSKQGDLRLIGHRDLARSMERLFRRAGLQLAMSEGYHPHPRVRFPSALPLGVEGENEVVEVELTEAGDAEQIARQLTAHTPAGLVIRQVQKLPPGAPKAKAVAADYRLAIPAERCGHVAQAVHDLLAQERFLVSRPGRADAVDARGGLERLQLTGTQLSMTLRLDRPDTPRPREILAALGLDDLESQGIWLIRQDVHLAQEHPA